MRTHWYNVGRIGAISLWLTQHSILDRGDKQSRGFTTLNVVLLGVMCLRGHYE